MGDQVRIEQEPSAVQSRSESSDVRGSSEAFTCSVCGLPISVGEWPCVKTIRPHGRSVQTDVFVPYFDVGLGEQINSYADRWRHMRQKQMQYRDLPSTGDLSARRDRLEERKKEEARG